MRAVVLTIGDELLIGQVANSNASWIGEQLSLVGVDVCRMTTVGDDEATLVEELKRAFEDASFVVSTGGLGPTHDDITREAIARQFGVELRFHQDVYDEIVRRFSQRARRMPESNRAQAMVPDGFTVLPNSAGTAPGLWYASRNAAGEKILAVLPGVPHEMKRLMLNEVIPRLADRKDLRVIRHRTLHTAGIGESRLQEVIGDLSDLLSPSLRLAYLPGFGGVRLRLTAFGRSAAKADDLLSSLEGRLRARIERYVYGTDGETLESVVGRMLKQRGLTIAFAESCTGGHLTHQVTNVSGSSDYMLGGIIAYSNKVKIELLGVDPEILEREGAVSERVARDLAAGIRRLLGSDIGVSTTGIAGPTGGTPDKPVGTVWIAYADASGVEARLLRLADERLLNKELTTAAVLDLVRRHLLRR